MYDGLPQRSFRTQQTRKNDKQNSAFRPAEVSIRRRRQAATSGAGPFEASFPSLATEEYLSEMAESFAGATLDAVAK